MKSSFGNIVLPADRLDGLVRIGLMQYADDLFKGVVLFLFYEPTP